MEAVIAISLWALGAVVAIGTPAAIITAKMLSWTRLPESRGYTKGPGPSPDIVDAALCSFRRVWGRRGLGPFEVAGLRVEWRAGDYFEERIAGKMVKLEGIARGPKLVTVAFAPGEKLGTTAFFHELIHAALQQQGKRDPDHNGGVYKGWTDAHDALEREMKTLWQGAKG